MAYFRFHRKSTNQFQEEDDVTTSKGRAGMHPSEYVRSIATDFAHEMLNRRAIVLKGIAKNVNQKSTAFTIYRPGSSHLVIWSRDTGFLRVSPETLNDTEVYVRGRMINGRLLAEIVAA